MQRILQFKGDLLAKTVNEIVNVNELKGVSVCCIKNLD